MPEPAKLLPVPPTEEVKKRKRRVRLPFKQRAGAWIKARRDWVRQSWEATDIRDRLFFPGLALIGIGVYQLRPPVAAIVVGALLVLAVRPLRSWL